MRNHSYREQSLKKYIFLAVYGLVALAAHAEVVNIDSTELARLSASGVPLVDIRTEGECKSTGVIAGSKLPTYVDEKGLSNPPQWLEKLKAIVKSGQSVILICRSGKRSSVAAQFLAEQAGYKTVYNVGKGLSDWVGQGRPTVPLPI